MDVPAQRGTQRTDPLRLIEQKKELISIADIDSIPRGMRGIYVLYRTADSDNPRRPHRHVVYVGMSATGIKGRYICQEHVRRDHGLGPAPPDEPQ